MRRRNEKKARRRAGQAILEYVLLMTALAMVSIGFTRFVTDYLFGAGFSKLPAKVSACTSHVSLQELQQAPCR